MLRELHPEKGRLWSPASVGLEPHEIGVYELVSDGGTPAALHVPADRVPGLSREVIEKLSRHRPRSIGQASRIPGITPAAVSILLIVARGWQQAATT